MKQKTSIILCLLVALTTSGCEKKSCKPLEPTTQEESCQEKTTPKPSDQKLAYEVENTTGKTVYVTGFAYLHRRPLSVWRWSKSPVYEIQDDQTVTITHAPIQDPVDRANVFGYLAVFTTKQAAEDATIQITPESNILDLDLLHELKNKKVVIEIERYGFKGPFLDYDFLKKDKETKKAPELTFFIQNNTGKTIYVPCFAYEKKAKGTWIAALEEKDDMSTWRFDKVGVYQIEPNNAVYVNIDNIVSGRDRSVIWGYLGIFDEDEEQLALDSTFELLESKRKVPLGLLEKLRNKTIAIEIEKYGTAQDIVDFTIKPIKRINFTQINQKNNRLNPK